MSSPEEPSIAPGRGVSRRLLLGSGLLVVGVVGGGVAGLLTTDPPREAVPDPVPPADVLAAIARERDLLATYDAALAAGADPLWSHLRAEHAEHAAALEALLPAGVSASASASASSLSTPGTGVATTPPGGATTAPTSPALGATGPTSVPPGAAALLAAERAAADAARVACLAGNGTAAVLLACIAASEASHAAVLA